MRVSVIGTGYLGATHAVCMAEIGHDVVAVDVDSNKVARLAAGQLPFFEPELDTLLKRNLAGGRLRFTDSFAEAGAFADVHFLAVGTPQLPDGPGADLSHIYAAIDSLAAHLHRPALIVGKSTVPVGTAADLAARVRAIAPAADAVELAWNPEFLREGYAVQDTLRPDRVVLGVDDPATGTAESTLREVYAPILAAGIPFLTTNLPTAELVKVAANAFLATKISFINAIAEVCEVTSADVTKVADAIGYDERIGRRFLNAGLGFGGGCLPKDIRAFQARADELGVGDSLSFLREVDTINIRQRGRVVEVVREMCDSVVGARVAVLGASFKPDSDDVRDSPALDVAAALHLQGAHVTVYDPEAIDNARRLLPALNYATSTAEACSDADVVLVLTEWDEFCKLQPDDLSSVVVARQIVDGRNCLSPDLWRGAGWTYRGFARP